MQVYLHIKGGSLLLFDYIIMSCCSRFKDGRSISAVYHLLKGKRSIQTVQDSHIYQLNRFYGIYPSLQKRDFEEHIHQLADEDMLLLNNTNAAMTTVRGENWLREQKKHVPVNYFNGMEYYQKASIFLERLLLLIQTMTNSKKNNFHFIPVVDKRIATNWVKRQYYQTHRFQANFLNQLYEELYQLLKCFSEMERSEEHTSELQSRFDLVCRLLPENENVEGHASDNRSSVDGK